MPVRRNRKTKRVKAADDDDVIKVTANLVSLDVIVKRQEGQAITDLQPEDFTVFENGVPQKIQFFDSTLTSGSEAGQPTTVTGSTEPSHACPPAFAKHYCPVLDGQSTEAAN